MIYDQLSSERRGHNETFDIGYVSYGHLLFMEYSYSSCSILRGRGSKI